MKIIKNKSHQNSKMKIAETQTWVRPVPARDGDVLVGVSELGLQEPDTWFRPFPDADGDMLINS